jgi:LmbE family N-acetylglucosaminyl deacetylase
MSAAAAILTLAPAFLLLGAAALAFVRSRRYRRSFRIPARREDGYRFRCAPRVLPLSADGEIRLPDVRFPRGSSAFLALDVAVSAAGQLLDPYIEFRTQAVSGRQYFERGAAGRRYLNLSPALQQSSSSPGPVRLQGRHLRWARQAELLVFEPPPQSGSTLVLSPHPDDSELAAFGYYSGRDSWIVTITAGERSPTDLSAIVAAPAEACRWLARLRVWDSLTIPRLGGVPAQRCLNLAFPDTRLRQMRESPTARFQLGGEDGFLRASLRSANRLAAFRRAAPDSTWHELVSDLQRVINMARPTTVVCPHPLIDPHHDHVHTALALGDALRAGAHPPEAILLYVVHANEAPIYPFGDATSIVSLPPCNSADWVAESIYSHPLSEETRRAKYFSVEAAHDLRMYGPSRPAPLRNVARAVRREILDFLTGIPSRPSDFLRRAPRPNEVFFVVSPDGFLDLAHRAAQRATRGNRTRSP